MENNLRWYSDASKVGFVQIPNLLIDYHEELGIDEKELLFLIKLSRHHENFKVSDFQVVTGCQKNAQRRRKSLKAKRLFNFQEIKETHYIDGKQYWRTLGFVYDLTVLNTKLQELYERLELEKTTGQNCPEVGQNCPEVGQNCPEPGHQSPAYNTNYNTNYNTKKNSSVTTTLPSEASKESTHASVKNTASKNKHRASVPLKYMNIIDAYKTHIDESYIAPTADYNALKNFVYLDRLESYIPYWNKFIGNHPDALFRHKTLDDFQKANTAQIFVMIQVWNKFNKYAQSKIDSEKVNKENWG